MDSSQVNRLARNGLLILAGGARQLFDHLAIAVARLLIHFGIDVRWIVAQNVFDPADALKKVLPILGGQHAQTRYAVGNSLTADDRVGQGQRGQRICPGQIGDAADALRQELDEPKAEHHGQCPQFARCQWREVLIEMHKARNVLQIELRLAHHDQFFRDGIDTRITLQRPCVAFRQLAIETGRHILADLAAGLLYQIEIIRQPLGGLGERLGVGLGLQLPRRCAKQLFLGLQIVGQRKGRIGHALPPPGFAVGHSD